MLTTILVYSLAVLGPAEPPAVAAQRKKADDEAGRGAFVEAAMSYAVLAGMPGADRWDALDWAHFLLEAAWRESKQTPYLCRAVTVAEQIVAENNFPSPEQAQRWRSQQDQTLAALKSNAVASNQANCRFDATGNPVATPKPATTAPRVALLPDPEDDEKPVLVATEATQPQSIAPPPAGSSTTGPKLPAPVLVVPTLDTRQHRRRTHRIAGAVLASVGAGLTGGMIGALVTMEKHHGALRSQLAERDGQRFSATQFADTQATIRQATEVRGLAIGLGVGAAVSVTTAIIVWATGKDRRDTRTSRVNFTGTTLQF